MREPADFFTYPVVYFFTHKHFPHLYSNIECFGDSVLNTRAKHCKLSVSPLTDARTKAGKVWTSQAFTYIGNRIENLNLIFTEYLKGQKHSQPVQGVFQLNSF